MQNRTVLNVAAITNHDGRHVTPGHGSWPETCTRADLNITHHHGTFSDPGLWINPWGTNDEWF
jgi:hypothetical protein